MHVAIRMRRTKGDMTNEDNRSTSHVEKQIMQTEVVGVDSV
jgi:hypothetical protein